jgi:pyruvate carboxylase
MPQQQKLLALNRGEIAIRIMRAATEPGLRTVAIYSREDRLSLHRFKADEAWQVGEGLGPVQAYLDVEGIVALAKETDVSFVAADQKQKADPAKPGDIPAPLPGMIAIIAVKKGDRLLVIEAMKMQTTVYASMDGKVTRLPAQSGQTVEAKDLLAVIS